MTLKKHGGRLFGLLLKELLLLFDIQTSIFLSAALVKGGGELLLHKYKPYLMESCLPLLPINPPDSRSLILHGGQSQPGEGKPLPLTRYHILRLWSVHSDHIDCVWGESGPASVDSHESLFCRISVVFLTQIKIRPPANAHHSSFQTLQTIWRSVSPLTNLYLAVQSCEIRIFKCFNGHLGDFRAEEEVLRVITRGRVLLFLRQIHLPDWQLGQNFERCFFFLSCSFSLNKD